MVTVAEMFTNNDLALRPIHIAAPDAAIRWVATSELPDPTPFFQGGEILLTTGLQTVGWTAQWKAYVEALAKSGTVALGLATGLTYDQSPRELIDACRSAGFNLFEVPRRTPFVAVSHRVSRLLADEEEAGAREALAVQRKLTAAAAKPDGARAVLPVLAQALRGSAAVVSADGNVQLDAVGQRRGDLVVAELVPELRRLRQQGRRAATTLSSPSGTTVLQPIGVGGRPSSFLAVLGPASLSDSQRNAINTTVALLSLIAEQGRNAAETRRRLRAHAIDLVIAGDVRTAQLVLDVDSRAPTLPASMRFLRATAGTGHLDDALEFLEARNLLSARHDGELWVVMDGEVARGLAAELAATGLHVGIGNRVSSSDASSSHQAAGLALTQAVSTAPVVDWEQVLRRGPLGLIGVETARQFAASYLGDLDEDQLDMLRCFLRHHGSHAKIAEELGVHRNTVRNRLSAIAKELPGDLDDPQTRASAWIALQSLA